MELYEKFAAEPKVQRIPCWHDSELLLLPDCEVDTFAAWEQAFAAAGTKKLDYSEREGNRTAVYAGEDGVYTLSYTAFEKTCRLIRDTTTDLPLLPDASAPICPVLVTQMRLLYCCADCGMLYLIRLGDGRFAVIDAGMGEHEEPEHLWELLESQNVREGSPTIAAWFFTHPHIDHYNTFVHFMERHGDKVVLESVLYNWPTTDMAKGFSDLTGFDMTLAALPNTKKITPRDGWNIVFPGVTFHVLYTCEDLYPTPFVNINDTSMVMRMDVGDRRVLWLGDASGAASDYITQKYSRDTLACEILQVGHHGYWGGSDRLYRTADPEILLWPCPDFWYQVITNWECNRYLVGSKKIHAIFVSGRQEVTLDLSAAAPIPSDHCYGDYTYEEDFTDISVYHKAWSSVTGGSTGYRGMDVSIERGVCHLSAGESWSVLEWRQPGQMPDSYTFTAKMCARTIGRIALFWNHPTPTVWSDDAVLPLPLPLDLECTVVLTADAEAGRATLTIDGEIVWQSSYTPADKHGLYLLLQNAAVDVMQLKLQNKE